MGGDPEVVLEESETVRIVRDRMGRQLFKGVATLPLGCPLASMDDWLKVTPPREFHEGRFGKE